MQLNPADKSILTKYTQVAKKVIYDANRMRKFLTMMGSQQGAVQAVQTVVAAIDKLKPVPPQILPMLAVNCYMIMVDVAQEATGHQADPKIMDAVIGQILQTAEGMKPQAPAQDQGMLAQMQQGTGSEQESEPTGEGPGPDNTAQHEGAEPAATEQAEGAEEDGPAGEEDGMLAQMQRRRVAA